MYAQTAEAVIAVFQGQKPIKKHLVPLDKAVLAPLQP